jgi:hypothetical protein
MATWDDEGNEAAENWRPRYAGLDGLISSNALDGKGTDFHELVADPSSTSL